MEEVGVTANRDALGNPYALSFGGSTSSDSDSFDVLFVEMVSPGYDGESGTVDDIAFWMSISGEFHEEAFSRDEP
jgi:hypothetical protein